jgi:N-acetylmuramoyl-L-alanine amidase
MKFILILTSLLFSQVRLNDIAELQWYQAPIDEIVEIQGNNGLLSISPLSNILLFNDSVYPKNVTLINNGSSISIDSSWTPWLDSLHQGEVDWVKDNFKFASSKDFQGYNIEPKSNGTLVNLNFNKKFRYEIFWNRPYYILRFENLDFEKELPQKKFTRGPIRRIIGTQEKHSAQITFEVNHLVGDINLIEKGNNLQLLLRKPIKKKASKTKNKKTLSSRKIKTIIIDAGHGGRDPGAVGAKHHEKEITLAVAKELKKQLTRKGFKVKLTRSDDSFIPLQKRPKLASDWDGDLFISLHCNAIPGSKKRKKSVKGFKIFILREAKSEEDKTIARRENAFISKSSTKKKNISPVEWILLEHQLNLYTKESERFTSHIVEHMEKNKHIHKHGSGASQAGFYVLVGAYMPAVLVEMGFISNPKEEKYMGSSKGQKNHC